MIKFPFFNVQELNLDWIMAMLKKILDFMPMNGSAGDVLQRNVDGAAWMPISAVSLDIHSLNTASGLDSADEFAIYDNSAQGNYKVTLADILAEVPASAVTSVNGQTGTVVLDASDVSALPDTTTIPTDTSDLTNGAGFITAAGAPVQSVNGQTGAVIISGGGAVDSVNGQTGTVVLGKSDVGLGNVDNVQQYSASNPPPYPVTSVNGQTGAVTVSGSSMVFGTDQALTITTPPSNVTVYSDSLYGVATSDGNNIRIYGNITTSFPSDTTGWKDFIVSGLTFNTPSAQRTVYNCGHVFYSPTGVDPNEHIMHDIYGNLRIRVLTDGTLRIGVYYPTIGTSDVCYISVMPFILPLA